MRSFTHLYLLALLALFFSLGCQFAARLSPLNLLKTTITPTPLNTPLAQDTIKRPPSVTPTPTLTRTPTPTPDFQATSAVITKTAYATQTEQARPMFEQIQKLQAEGRLTSTSGAWYKIDNFDQNLSETTGYFWWNTGVQPVDFVVRADVEWWSTDTTSNLFNAGCGFVFRAVDKNNRLATILTLDGKARFDRLINGDWLTPILSASTPVLAQNDRAELILIVENNHLTLIKDGVDLLSLDDDILSSPKFQSGDLAIAMMSNTDIGFGTHCKFTNIEVWLIR